MHQDSYVLKADCNIHFVKNRIKLHQQTNGAGGFVLRKNKDRVVPGDILMSKSVTFVADRKEKKTI